MSVARKYWEGKGEVLISKTDEPTQHLSSNEAD